MLIYKNKICFLDYIIYVQKVKIQDEKIKVVKNWPKTKLV